MKKTTIAGLIGLLFTAPLLATETRVDADNVVVTASRIHEDIQNIPANIQVIGRDDIKSLSPSSVPQILSQLGGLIIRGNSLGQFNLGASVDIGGHGEAANNNTLVLINGQRISPIDSSSPAWEMIPVDAIDRIEIIRGAAAVQYGNRAVGGVINIITNEGQQNINRVSASFGSFNTQTLSALLQNKFNDTLIKVSANTAHTSGWRDNSAATSYAANARITQFFDENSVYFDIFGSHNNAQAPGGVIGLVGQGGPKSAKFNNIGSINSGENYGFTLGNFMQLNPSSVLEADIAYKKADLTYDEPYQDQNYQSKHNEYSRWSLTFSPRLRLDLKQWGRLTAGYDFSHAYGDDKKSSASLIDNSIYALHALPLLGNTELVTGYRRQIESATANDDPINNSPVGKKTTSADAWEVGLNYKFSSNEKLYLKYNQAFRFPNIDEFWGWDSNPPYGRIFKGAILTPQTDRSYQAGGDFLLGNTKFTASAFHTDTSNEIRYNPVAFENINDQHLIERNGVYLSTNSSITDRLALYTNSNLQDVSYANGPNRGKSVPLAPNLMVNARVNYKFDQHWSIGTLVNYVGTQYYNGANDYNSSPFPTGISNPYEKIPSYVVADVYAAYKSEHWDARVTIKNIGNSHYATYGGITSVSFQNAPLFRDSYYYYPSDPRSLLASVSYNF